MNSEQLAERICFLLDEKKATDITVMKVGHLTIVADYFVIATARSTAQAKAIYENVDEKLSKGEGLEPLRVDGTREGRWIVMDYGDVMVHIFRQEEREFYNLERLWLQEKNFSFHADSHEDLMR